MDTHNKHHDRSCKTDVIAHMKYREQLPNIVEEIIQGCEQNTCSHHIAYEPIPSREAVIEIIYQLREVLFPGYFTREKLDPVNLKYSMGRSVSVMFDKLAVQIGHSIRHDCFRYEQVCQDCEDRGYELTLELMQSIPGIQRVLARDVAAFYDGDPAAKNYDEIIFSYPGIFAIAIFRVAHRLLELGVPFLPRIMTEYGHNITGIDIHPGAQIGERFVIDHGTGVVIGETTQIGRNVRIYQGVTLGALSLPRDAGEQLRGHKRHPTIEEDVIIYSGATILGGDTVIGKRSVIGGNVWITKSIPPNTKVFMETPKLVYR